MGWISKIFKGSGAMDGVSKGKYPENSWPDDLIRQQYTYYDDSDDEDVNHAIALSLSEDDHKKGKGKVDDSVQADEELAWALQQDLNVESPPRQPVPEKPQLELPNEIHSNGYSWGRVCAGCKRPISYGRFLSCLGSFWHPECFRCHGCNQPIDDSEFTTHHDDPFHRSCYKELFLPKCDVCKNFIPSNKKNQIEYRAHPFWQQKYCPSHENDGTPRCCSCERMETCDVKYIALGDGRKLCLECLNTAIMDNDECQPLYLDIKEFYEGLNMKVEQQVPLLLVERQALNEAIEGEKKPAHYLPETRGLCLSEEQIVKTIRGRPRIGHGRIIDIFTTPYRLVRLCEVTAILVLYGLPRLLTGSILAHELMHAWFRLKGFRHLPPDVEEGMCQVLSHMWLESEIMSGSGGSSSSMASSSSSSSASSSSSSKKGPKSEVDKKLGEFFKRQIETDSSPAYGDGFRAGMRAVELYGLPRTLEHIRLTGSFP